MATLASPMTSHQFDDRNIQWRTLGDFEHLVASVFFVDEERNIVDFIIKFAPNEKVLLHRHLAVTTTFVVDGEHRIYEPDGRLREIRPGGRYTFSTASDAQNEGGGPKGGLCTSRYAGIVNVRLTNCEMIQWRVFEKIMTTIYCGHVRL